MTIIAIIAGGIAGTGMGYVLQRARLCFRATFSGVLEGRFLLARGWLLGVAIGSVGLSALFLTPLGDGLNQGLPFTPGPARSARLPASTGGQDAGTGPRLWVTT